MSFVRPDHRDIYESLGTFFYFLQYINGHAPQGKFVNEIDTEVGKVKESKEMEKSYMTYAMEIERHRREAKNIGIAIGRKEGSNIRAQKIALSMLEDKASIALISKYTGLTEQEIRALAKEHDLL